MPFTEAADLNTVFEKTEIFCVLDQHKSKCLISGQSENGAFCLAVVLSDPLHFFKLNDIPGGYRT